MRLSGGAGFESRELAALTSLLTLTLNIFPNRGSCSRMRLSNRGSKLNVRQAASRWCPTPSQSTIRQPVAAAFDGCAPRRFCAAAARSRSPTGRTSIILKSATTGFVAFASIVLAAPGRLDHCTALVDELTRTFAGLVSPYGAASLLPEGRRRDSARGAGPQKHKSGRRRGLARHTLRPLWVSARPSPPGQLVTAA